MKKNQINRRWLALTLCLALALGLFTPPAAIRAEGFTAPEEPFLTESGGFAPEESEDGLPMFEDAGGPAQDMPDLTQATPSGEPGYTPISEAGKTLADAGLNTGTLPRDGSITWEFPTHTLVTQGASYGWTFTPPPPNNENHSVLTGQIILWPALGEASSTTLTLTFDKDDNTPVANIKFSHMASLVKDALADKSDEEKAALTTIALTGEAASITGYNWECLRDLYIVNSIFNGLPKLSILDLSAMNDLTSIGNPEGRGGRPSKLTEIRFPSGLTSIGAETFYGCSGLTDLCLPNTLRSIGKRAFAYCSGLTNITLPNGLQSIGEKAFAFCSSLTNITLPDTLQSIATDSFYDCDNLASFAGAANNPSFEIRDGILYRKGMHTLFRYPPGKTEPSFQVPDGVHTIETGAFYGYRNLTEVTLPDSLRFIRDYAFSGCWNLTAVTFPGSLQSVGDSAFYSCSSLTEVTFPGSLLSIGNSAFSYCTSLTEVTFPGSLQSVGNSAFYSCSSLMEVTFSGSLQSIGQSIGDSAFSYCTSLMEITFSGSLQSIGDSAFYSCSSLTEITFPGSLLSIGNSAFSYCTSLTEVTFPGSLQSVGNHAFLNCTGLTSLTFKGYAPPSIGNNAFYGIASAGTIYYPIRSDGYTGDWKDNTLELTSWNLKAFGSAHSHSYGDWRFDGQEHWRECTCGSRDSLAAHTYGEWTTDLPGGSRKRTCTICAYEETNALPVPALRVTERTASSVSLAWEAVEGAEGYTVWYRSEHENKVSRRIIPGGDVTTWTHQRLVPGTKYFYTLRAWVSTKEGYLFGEQSPVQRGTTKPEAAVIQAVTAKGGRIKVTLAGGAKGAEYYSMCYSKAADFGDFQVGRRTRHTTRTFREDLPKGTYYIRVKSCRELGNGKRVYGEWSNQVKLRVK